MIDVSIWPTPNGHKVHIMLHETGLEHTIHPIDILTGRPVRCRVPGDQPQQQDTCDHRPPRTRRRSALGLRVRRYSHLPCQQDRSVPTLRAPCVLRRDAVVDVPDGLRGADARTRAPHPRLRAGGVPHRYIGLPGCDLLEASKRFDLVVKLTDPVHRI